MEDRLSAAVRYADDNRNRFLEELKEFLTIPSVSTDPAHEGDLVDAAEWVADQLRKLGPGRVELYPAPASHPVVFGELRSPNPGAKTVLVYGHYDVQPAEPLNHWTAPPFEPVVKDDKLYARGATDMKGQVMAVIKAVEAITRNDEIPIHIKFLIEGEEEVGSPHLGDFIANHRELLACDYALNPDTGMIHPDLPTITYALRGLAYFELRVYGPSNDLHSGVYGGVVHNPAQALCELIAGMHDEAGRVTLPGFYDRVRPMDMEERGELARLPMGEQFYLEKTGAPALWGERGYTPVERAGGRPTLEINGLLSGFTGDGSKTVLPAYALAKISTRLVPDQDPDEVHQQLLRYLQEKAPETIRWEVHALAGGRASLSERDSDGVSALSRAFESVWGVKPVFKREGGSVPVVSQLQEHLGVEAVNTGFSLPGDNMHGPDETLHLPTWYQGIRTLIHFFYNLNEPGQAATAG